MSGIEAADFLQTVYSELGFAEGGLFNATNRPPTDTDMPAEDWIDKGEWLSLAAKIAEKDIAGVDKIFFVDQNPVIVFARHESDDDESLRRFFNKIWNMARPPLLFLARPGELAVLDLTQGPLQQDKQVLDSLCLLDIVRRTDEVQSKLQKYHREQIETGRLFEENRFEQTQNRADEALIRDLKAVRKKLCELNLDLKYAHRLIARSIFVRYLEDREILLPEYFHDVAKQKYEWLRILETPQHDVAIEMENILYPKVLSDKEFTFALFDQLAKDFHGDMFPADPQEKQSVESEHLICLQSFLRGSATSQESLFFFAYKFNIIPIELISSIYEEFYNVEQAENNQGSHYTPSALVDFVLSQVFTPERLEQNPRILDPACGSGIFLVEAFRRIVRYRVQRQQGKLLERTELLEILRDQIAGIDINSEAVRIAAFSLYLAFLHYQYPPDIRRNPRLPNLIYDNVREEDKGFEILLATNAFKIEGEVFDPDVRRKFASRCTDIVVGNPPWGYPLTNPQILRTSSCVQSWPCASSRLR